VKPKGAFVRRLLKKLPLARRAKRAVRMIRKAYDRRFGAERFRRALAAYPHPKIVIGAGSKLERGWLNSQMEFLNLLQPADWERFFQPDSIEAILAEHVWEHLTPEEGLAAARTCFKYLRPGGYLRVAVPDGLHPDPTYLEWVKVGGASPMQVANDHKVLYTHGSLGQLFESAGFRVQLYEYFDAAGTFHYHEWDERGGKVWRSKRFDPRNTDGKLVFTSIVLDAIKDVTT
jgi:predicted SAM-dependent methyltransferase